MPSGGYYIKEHIEYFAAFMEAVVPANEKVVFVIHDWGFGLGFDWARKNEERMAGLVCMEFIHMMVTTEDFVGWERNLTKMRDPVTGHQCVIEENYFVEVILREEGTSKGSLPDAVMEHYRRSFAHPADREPQWRIPNEIPP
jgi:haloalkane dehalogenase